MYLRFRETRFGDEPLSGLDTLSETIGQWFRVLLVAWSETAASEVTPAELVKLRARNYEISRCVGCGVPCVWKFCKPCKKEQHEHEPGLVVDASQDS